VFTLGVVTRTLSFQCRNGTPTKRAGAADLLSRIGESLSHDEMTKETSFCIRAIRERDLIGRWRMT
jgi:hypothetical protein